jgi:two-component system phosphate regulon sensor histidine kinase PhoR
MPQRTLKSRMFWRFLVSYSGVVMICAALFALFLLFQLKAELSVLMIGMSASADEAITAAIKTRLHDHVLLIAVILVGGILIDVSLAFFLSRRTTKPLAQMIGVSEAMLEGRYDQRVLALPTDEMGLLGRTLNRLSGELTAKIETLSLERAQFKTILANMIEGIICVDEQGSIMFCNEAAYRLFDLSKSDVRGMRLTDVSGFSQLGDVIDDAWGQSEAVSRELVLRRGEMVHGKLFLQVQASPFQSDSAAGVIVVVQDITKVRRLEKMRRDFVANVSHEIKTPLTAIRGYVETLISDGVDDQELTTRFLEKVDRNAKRLNSLVSDILTLAKIEDEEQNLAVVPVAWDTIVQHVASNFEDLCRERNLHLEVRIDQADMQVLGEREAMTQVLDNLVSNAIRYTPAGGSVAVSISQSAGQVVLAVRDTGIGIPKKYQTRIFERFYRIDKARSRDAGGTGLGLAIVKHLVASMGGTVDVESEVGQGSVFTVRLKSFGALRPKLNDQQLPRSIVQ